MEAAAYQKLMRAIGGVSTIIILIVFFFFNEYFPLVVLLWFVVGMFLLFALPRLVGGVHVTGIDRLKAEEAQKQTAEQGKAALTNITVLPSSNLPHPLVKGFLTKGKIEVGMQATVHGQSFKVLSITGPGNQKIESATAQSLVVLEVDALPAQKEFRMSEELVFSKTGGQP